MNYIEVSEVKSEKSNENSIEYILGEILCKNELTISTA